jgi:hypothetical protein
VQFDDPNPLRLRDFPVALRPLAALALGTLLLLDAIAVMFLGYVVVVVLTRWFGYFFG